MKPGIAAKDEAALPPKNEHERDSGANGGGGGKQSPIDPIIQGLLARLPKSGEVCPESERNLWLDLLKGSFKLIYKDKPREYDFSRFSGSADGDGGGSETGNG